MDSPSPPQTPDPVVTANAQAAANSDAARTTTSLNRANQITPFGSLTWSQGDPTRTFNEDRYTQAVASAQAAAQRAAALRAQSGLDVQGDESAARGSGGFMAGNGSNIPVDQLTGFQAPDRNADEFWDMKPSDQWTSTVTLDPRVQQLVDSQLATSQGLQGAIDNSLGQVNDIFSQAPPEADNAARMRVEDALYDRYRSRLDPRFNSEEAAMRSQLMNRGLVEGSEAWNTQLDTFNRGKNDAFSTARNDAVIQGGNEMARLLGMEQSRRTGVINELNALRTGAQAQMPSFSATPSGASVNPAPVAQSIWNGYQGDMGMYNSGVASNNSMMGAGAAGIATIAAAFI